MYPGIRSARPAIEAWGLPIPQYTAQALQRDPGIPMPEYFSRRARSFQGEKTQYFLPFVPVSRVAGHW